MENFSILFNQFGTVEPENQMIDIDSVNNLNVSSPMVGLLLPHGYGHRQPAIIVVGGS